MPIFLTPRMLFCSFLCDVCSFIAIVELNLKYPNIYGIYNLKYPNIYGIYYLGMI